MFTEDQVDLMHLVAENSRLDLTMSDACETLFPMPPVAEFEADITTVVEGGSVNFEDLSTNFPTGWNWVVTPSARVSFIGGTSASSENPVIQFDNAGLHTVTLTATNGEGSDDEVKTNYIEVIAGGGGASTCDTSRNYTAAEFDNVAVYGVTDESGYYPSQLTLSGGTLNVEAYAESFNTSAPTFVKRLRLPIFRADDIGGASNVTFRVWNDVAGDPGAVLGSEVVPIADLTAGAFNIIDFSTPVPVSGDYWVGIEFDYSAGFDTVQLGTTDFDDRPSGPSSTSTFISGGVGWLLTSDLFGTTPDCSLIIDVLISNGPSPEAVVSFPITETCEGAPVTMNGFGSLNTLSYFWDISDGTDLFFFDEANLTTGFAEGMWTIQLIADGACESDLSPVFNLTINPPLDVDGTVANENCTAEDGEVEFTVTGGDGGPYSYSINEGATFTSSATFTGLPSGTYNFVIQDDANCEVTGAVEIDVDNTFSPSITPDLTIDSGTPTDLTVTGGSTWLWYAGLEEFIGETATVTVAPTETTTYISNVTDDDGCEAELEVTVTVEDGGGSSGINAESLNDGFRIYPNPSNGEINLTFDLVEAKDMSIKVVNILGDEIAIRNYQDIKQNTVKFDLTEIASGVYFVVLKTDVETISKKIVVQK